MNIRPLLTAAILCAAGAAFAQDATDTLKYSSFLPATTVNNAQSAPALIKEAATRSDGALKIELYPGGSLVSGGEVQLKLVQDGVADLAEVPLPYTPGRIEGLDVFELPNLAQSNSDGSLASLKLIADGKIKGIDDLVTVGVLQSGPYFIHTKDKIESLADLRGKKLRVSGQTQAQIVSRLGAVPVSNIPATGLAENVSRGLIDGALVDTGNLYNFGVGDLLKYHVTNLPLGNFAVLFPMTKTRYDGLSDKSKAAMDQLAGEWFTTELGKNMDAQTAAVTEKLKAAGDHVFVELSAEDLAKANEVLAQVTEAWVQKGDGRQEILDAAKAALAE
ncbi:TRAP transporter substrate-binding protein [Paracoccus pacificus]|uniref:TRAP transporter substrate-binding protein n=1 Tax=Paracoccus pacificus TaxID=1463598 RepID=A0ABW4R875_9RHOB